MSADSGDLVLRGLISKSGTPIDITISMPAIEDATYFCEFSIPGVARMKIYGETSLQSLQLALDVVSVQVYGRSENDIGPSPSLIAETTLQKDDFPDLQIHYRPSK